MIEQPIVETSRFLLRPLEKADIPAVQKSAGERKISDTMISIPYPYPAGEAERYVTRQLAEHEAGRVVTYIIEDKAIDRFCGLVEIREIDHEHMQAELSFWLGVDAWGQGCMSEILQPVVRYSFKGLGLNRLYAYSMLRNPASGRVLEKNGFKQEGLLRQRVRKWNKFEDVALWAILQQEWQDALGE